MEPTLGQISGAERADAALLCVQRSYILRVVAALGCATALSVGVDAVGIALAPRRVARLPLFGVPLAIFAVLLALPATKALGIFGDPPLPPALDGLTSKLNGLFRMAFAPATDAIPILRTMLLSILFAPFARVLLEAVRIGLSLLFQATPDGGASAFEIRRSPSAGIFALVFLSCSAFGSRLFEVFSAPFARPFPSVFAAGVGVHAKEYS